MALTGTVITTTHRKDAMRWPKRGKEGEGTNCIHGTDGDGSEDATERRSGAHSRRRA